MLKLKDFKEMWNKLGKTEKGAIKCYLIGVLEYIEGNKMAEKMIAITLPKPQLTPKGNPGKHEKYFLSLYKKYPNIAKSYFGGTPDNNYEYSIENDLIINDNSVRGDKDSKIFVQSGGKDFGSPVHLRKNKDGYWKLFGTSSLVTGVKKIEDDDF